MSTINDTYVNALLADASYVDFLLPGMTSAELEEKLSPRMTPTLARIIGDNFAVASSINTPDDVINGAGFDGVVWRGNAGTRYAGKLFVSMRGTQGVADFVTDANLALLGDAAQQTADMVNWWLRDSTPVGQTAPQIAWRLLTGTFVSTARAPGTGRIAAADLVGEVQVNGHSLGGYLASGFTRLLGTAANVTQTSTFNSAGFAAGAEAAFASLQALIGPELGRAAFPAAGNSSQLNYFAVHGLNLTTNTWWFGQVGKRIGLFNEESVSQIPNHFMFKLRDALALPDAMSQLDPTLTIARANALFEAGSTQARADLERTLDGLRRVLLGTNVAWTAPGDVSDSAATRVLFHSNLKALTTGGAFTDLSRKLRVDVATGQFGATVRSNFSARVSLLSLSPVIVSGTDVANAAELQGVLQSAWGREFTDWQADRDLSVAERQAGKANYSDQWIVDRNVKAPPPAGSVAQARDMALLQIAAGVDLYGALGDAAGVKARLTGALGNAGTADRLTPSQADYLLTHYDVLHQYGNDGSGFSATVFRRKLALDAQGNPLPPGSANPYIIAFRGNDLEPNRACGLAKDGGFAAMREINRTGFAWGQLDAMERWWAGLGRGEVLNRAGVRTAAGAAAGAFSLANNIVIGSGVGAHLAAAFTLLHPDRVDQVLGFDGPGLGRMQNGKPITADQLREKLGQFIVMMADRNSPNATAFTQAIRDAGGERMRSYAFALEPDRPSEVQFSGYYDILIDAPGVAVAGWDTYQASRGWENYWNGANICQSQLYQFAVDWFGRDTRGAGQGTSTAPGVGSDQLAAAWAAYSAAGNQDPWGGPNDIDAFALPGLSLGGDASGKYTSWNPHPDRLDPSSLLGGQGLAGAQKQLWVEDNLGIASPATLAELERQGYEHGWGNNTALRPYGSAGNLTRLVDSLELAAFLQAVDKSLDLDGYADLMHAISRSRDVAANPLMPMAKRGWDAERFLPTQLHGANRVARLKASGQGKGGSVRTHGRKPMEIHA